MLIHYIGGGGGLRPPAGLNISTGRQKISGKKRVMFDESCFTTDTVARRKV